MSIDDDEAKSLVRDYLQRRAAGLATDGLAWGPLQRLDALRAEAFRSDAQLPGLEGLSIGAVDVAADRARVLVSAKQTIAGVRGVPSLRWDGIVYLRCTADGLRVEDLTTEGTRVVASTVFDPTPPLTRHGVALQVTSVTNGRLPHITFRIDASTDAVTLLTAAADLAPRWWPFRQLRYFYEDPPSIDPHTSAVNSINCAITPPDNIDEVRFQVEARTETGRKLRWRTRLLLPPRVKP